MSNLKVAIVTGAGSGVGRATAVLLAHAGYTLVLVGRNQQKLLETQDQIGTKHAGVLLTSTDLSDANAAREIAVETIECFGRIDAIANVAGQAPMLSIQEVTPAILKECMDTNFSYVVHLTSAAWPIFKKQGSGIVVNVSSMASFDPFPGLGIYAAAKAAVNMFTHCTAQEGQEIGVKAVCVAPGAIETGMLRSLFGKDVLPTDKTLDPKEVAGFIVDCITGKRAFKNGETVPLPSP